MAKALAIRTLFLVIVIGFIIFFSLIAFWHWMNLQDIQTNRYACIIKYQNYCLRCIQDNSCPMDWNTVAPTNCEQLDITEPSLEKCKEESESIGEQL